MHAPRAAVITSIKLQHVEVYKPFGKSVNPSSAGC